jgi:hypothetical protein
MKVDESVETGGSIERDVTAAIESGLWFAFLVT